MNEIPSFRWAGLDARRLIEFAAPRILHQKSFDTGLCFPQMCGSHRVCCSMWPGIGIEDADNSLTNRAPDWTMTEPQNSKVQSSCLCRGHHKKVKSRQFFIPNSLYHLHRWWIILTNSCWFMLPDFLQMAKSRQTLTGSVCLAANQSLGQTPESLKLSSFKNLAQEKSRQNKSRKLLKIKVPISCVLPEWTN